LEYCSVCEVNVTLRNDVPITPTRVSHIALPYSAVHPNLWNSCRAMLKSAMSRTNAITVTSLANEDQISTPQRPNNTPRPHRPAAMGCKTRV